MWTTDLGDASAALRSAAGRLEARELGEEISIDELKIGPVDLAGCPKGTLRAPSRVLSQVMVHWPMPGKHVEAYVALEELVRSGRAKALGAGLTFQGKMAWL